MNFDYLLILMPAIIAHLLNLLFPMDKAWYESLVKPEYTPPPLVFAIVWPILYLLIGIVLFYNTDSSAMKILFVNLFLNYLWIIAFNQLQDIKMSLAISVLMLLTLVYYFGHDWTNISVILIPYFLWLIYATYLNYQFYIDN